MFVKEVFASSLIARAQRYRAVTYFRLLIAVGVITANALIQIYLALHEIVSFNPSGLVTLLSPTSP